MNSLPRGVLGLLGGIQFSVALTSDLLPLEGILWTMSERSNVHLHTAFQNRSLNDLRLPPLVISHSSLHRNRTLNI